MKVKNQITVEKLNQLLADYQIHYQNLRGLHWNIKGQMFFALHDKFEAYYNNAADVIDEIAERILMLGGQPLHTFEDYTKTAKLAVVANVSEARTAVESVLESERYFLESLNQILKIAGDYEDEGTAAMVSEWIGQTEKEIWMLESFLA